MKIFSRSMKSRSDSLERSVRLTRRTATVTISAAETSRASFIIGNEAYLPVPTINREAKLRPPSTRRSAAGAFAGGVSTSTAVVTLSSSFFRRLVVKQENVVDQAGLPHVHCGRERRARPDPFCAPHRIRRDRFDIIHHEARR